MRLTRNLFVLTFLYGISSASWGPSELTVDSGDSHDDFLDLNVQWKKGSCPLASYRVYSETPGQGRKHEASTRGTKVTITGKEFWTNYTITLDTWYCLVEKPQVTQIYTGPGNPHKVTSVKTTASALNASVSIEEAFMPRPVDLYDVTWCSFRGCQSQNFTRNSSEVEAVFDFDIEELVPYTPYNLTVTPEISFRNETFRGPEYAAKFTTEDVYLPAPANIRASTFEDDDNHPETRLTWELEDCPFQLAFYNVTMKYASDDTILESQSVKVPEAIFIDMPESIQLIANVTPIYNISGALVHRSSAAISIKTPKEGNFAWWIIVVALIGIAVAVAAVGFVLYKRRNSKPDDTEQLVTAGTD